MTGSPVIRPNRRGRPHKLLTNDLAGRLVRERLAKAKNRHGKSLGSGTQLEHGENDESQEAARVK
jgi:hypothetical protein